MIIKEKDKVRYENSEKCIAYEYPFNDKDLNIAIVEITDKYPDTGTITNESVKEIIYVLEGNGQVIIEGKEYKLEQGDAFLILPKQKYSYRGNFKLFVSCNPAWFPEQHKIINSS